jgi:putative intracellular protease/amidase
VNSWAARNEQSVNGDGARQRIGNQFHARGGADRSAGYGGELTILPTQTRESAKASDILVVPGGPGIDYAMLDDGWIAYARREAAKAKYVFSVCTGSLLLAAAGLLTGRRAGGHWQARDLLARFGVTPSDARLTVDGKFYTSAGVTSGIDMALLVVADIVGEETARKIQLSIEYDPAPPFPGGTPFTSPPEIVKAVLDGSRQRRADRERIVTACVRRGVPSPLEAHNALTPRSALASPAGAPTRWSNNDAFLLRCV